MCLRHSLVIFLLYSLALGYQLMGTSHRKEQSWSRSRTVTQRSEFPDVKGRTKMVYNARHSGEGRGCWLEGDAFGEATETGLFVDGYNVHYLFNRCWALDPWFLSLLQSIHGAGVTWPSTLPHENWGLGNQHKYVDIVITNFALSSKVFCLWSRDLMSSVSIHETNLLACKEGIISDPLFDRFNNKDGTLTDT